MYLDLERRKNLRAHGVVSFSSMFINKGSDYIFMGHPVHRIVFITFVNIFLYNESDKIGINN